MSNTNVIFDGADLSLAAYATLQDGVATAAQIESLKNGNSGMSETQAMMFAVRWPDVVEQYTDPVSGFSATLFRNGSEVCLAIAGTDSPLDVAIDIGLAEGLGAQAQYNALQAFYSSLLSTGKIQSTDSVTVTGHSLGGFLAQVFAVDHAGEITQTYTYNAPGIGGSVAQMLDWMDVVVSNIDTSNILNVQGDGFSVTAGLGTLLGSVQQVQIENNSIWVPGDHTIKKLTDSLAVYDTLWQLDNSLSIGTFNSLFKQSSNSEDASLEGMVDALQKMFGTSNTPLEIDDRDEFYSAVYAVRDTDAYGTLVNNASVGSSAGISGQQASTDFGAFLALHYFSPVYISGAALAEPNEDLYGQWSSGAFSSQYLEDRAAMLNALLGANSSDADYDDVRGVYFSDAGTGAIVGATSDGLLAPDNRRIVFGADGSDNIAGGSNNDHLYGGGGADSLYGGAGDDYLEGGSGNDVLNPGTGFDHVNGGAGNDTYQIALNNVGDAIISGDTDGGTISLLGGVTFRKVGAGEANTNGLYIAVDENGDWLSGKEGWAVSVSGSTATVMVKDGDGKSHVIAIENFNISSNNFGISFDTAASSSAPAQTNAYTVGDGQDFLQQQLDNAPDDPFEHRSLNYNAADYLYHKDATVEDDQVTDPVVNDHAAITYVFNGRAEADVLNGNDWRSTQEEDFDPEYDYYSYGNDFFTSGVRLQYNGNMTDSTGWTGDVIDGGDGDDIITGDGNDVIEGASFDNVVSIGYGRTTKILVTETQQMAMAA